MVRKYVSDIVTEKLGYSLLKLSQKRYNTHTSLQKPRIFFPKQQLIYHFNGHIKTTEQAQGCIMIQQYGDWYTGR